MALGQNPAFVLAGVAVINAGTVSAGVALVGSGDTAVVTNASTALAWVAFGGGASPPVATPGTGYAVPAGAQRVVGCGTLATQVGVVLASGAGAVYVERGSGAAR